MSTYNYSLTTDFGNSINVNRLSTEITDDITITKTLLSIDINDDTVSIIFDQSLTTGEQSALDSLVASHDSSAYDVVGSNSASLKVTTADPSSNDDILDGYVIGSQWMNTTNDKSYVCLDNSIGAAIWKELTQDTHIVATSGVHGISGYVVGTTDTQTLSNKTLLDTTSFFANSSDATKKIKFSLSGLTTSSTRTITIPNTDFTMSGSAVTEMLSNKTFGSDLNMGSFKITNMAEPSSSSDGATKNYVDSVASGLDFKSSVVVASTEDLNSNSSISGSITYNSTGGSSGRGQITATLTTSNSFIVDGVTFSSTNNGSRILLKNQTSGAQNGIWTTVVSGTSLTLDRAIDFDADSEVTSGAFCFIEQGTIQADQGWVLSTQNPIVVGGASGTSLSFVQFTGTGQITAGAGLTKTLNVLDIGGSSSIIVNADNIEVNSSGTSNQVLLSSGTIGSASTFGALPLNNSNAVTGTLPIGKGGTNSSSFASGSKLIATNSGNSALEATSLDPSTIVTLAGSMVLTNKTLTDNVTYVQNSSDTSKKIQFDLSNITTGTTRNLIVPDATTTLVGADTTQTLSNKTLTSPIIASISNTGTITLPTSTDTLVGRATTDTLTNKTFTDNVTYFQDQTDNTKKMQFELSGITTSTTRTLTIPDASTTLVGTDATQTLTNKTINASNNSISNIINTNIGSSAAIDATKIADGSVTSTHYQYISGATSNIQTQINNHTSATVAHGVSGTLVGTSDTQTLTNKSLVDASTYFIDETDNTKKAQLELSNISAGTTRILIVPDTNLTFVGTSIAQTLTNKTINIDNNTVTNIADTNIKTSAAINANKIADGSVSNAQYQYLSGTTSNIQTQINTHTSATTAHGVSGTLVGTSDTQTLTNKSLIDTSTYFVDNVDGTKKAQFELSGITTGTTRILTFPDTNSTIVGNDAVQTLTNKTFTDNSTYFQDENDNSKKLQFQLSSIATATTRTLTIPDASTTLVGTDATQTLTNKTISASSNTLTDIVNSSISGSAAIDATKIADGSVTNTKFQYISNLASDAQTQINTKVTGAASSTDNAIARFDATTGKIVQNSGIIIDDSNNVSGFNYLEINDVSAPANPGSGKGRLYKKTGNGSIFWKPDAASAEVDLTALSFSQIVVYRDEKTSGTNGGTFSSGAWRTRTLNTTDGSISGASLSSNQFTLPSGTYLIEGSASAYDISLHQLRIQNTTDSSTVAYGIAAESNTLFSAGGQNMATINCTVTISNTKTFELQHRCTNSKTTTGFGQATGFGGTEVYAYVQITKVS